jgi:hypothetical protein
MALKIILTTFAVAMLMAGTLARACGPFFFPYRLPFIQRQACRDSAVFTIRRATEQDLAKIKIPIPDLAASQQEF